LALRPRHFGRPQRRRRRLRDQAGDEFRVAQKDLPAQAAIPRRPDRRIIDRRRVQGASSASVGSTVRFALQQHAVKRRKHELLMVAHQAVRQHAWSNLRAPWANTSRYMRRSSSSR
jgi:hypothetical protein